MTSTLASTPTNPASLSRDFGPVSLTLSAEGLTIALAEGPRLTLPPEETLAVSDFLRGPGARSLIGRAWLAAQHVEGLNEG